MNRLSKYREKICNICGEDVLVYTIIDNAPLCEKCVPIKKQIVKSEREMILKIIGGGK